MPHHGTSAIENHACTMETDILFRQQKKGFSKTLQCRALQQYNTPEKVIILQGTLLSLLCQEITGRDGLGTTGHTWLSSSLLLWPYMDGCLENQSL
jgi:hypothetical protein